MQESRLDWGVIPCTAIGPAPTRTLPPTQGTGFQTVHQWIQSDPETARTENIGKTVPFPSDPNGTWLRSVFVDSLSGSLSKSKSIIGWFSVGSDPDIDPDIDSDPDFGGLNHVPFLTDPNGT